MDICGKENIQLEIVETVKNLGDPTIIDWPGCVNKSMECVGDADFVIGMLSIFAKDLIKSQKTLSTSYHFKDNQALQKELHRIQGGLCYFELPELWQTVSKFYNIIKSHSADKNTLDIQYQAVMQAIHNFLEIWNKLSQKLNIETLNSG